MNLFETVIITLHLSSTLGKRKMKRIQSLGGADNLLYVKDCCNKQPTAPIKPLANKEVLREAVCPFPRMCCSMTCDNECGGQKPSARSSQPFQSMAMPMQQQVSSDRKVKQIKMLPPIETRRSVFTKDHIKDLIAQDEDIKKILKDLVRVTMQKVDLEQIIEASRKKSDADVDTFNSEDQMYIEN